MLFNFSSSHVSKRAELTSIDSAVPMIIFKPDGTVKYANTLFLQAMGYQREEVVGQHHKLFCDPKYVQSDAYRRHWQLLNEGRAITDNIKRIRKDGSIIWLQGTYTPVLDSQGRVVEIIKLASDVTERMLQSQEHQSLLAALNRSMGMITFTPQGIILDANDNLLNVIGYSLADIRHKSHHILCTPEFAHSDEYRLHWQRLARGEFIVGRFERMNSRGQRVWLEASYNPIMDKEGQVLKVVKIAQDITQLMLQQEQEENLIRDVHHLSLTTDRSASQGAEIVQQAVRGMQEVESVARETSDVISELGRCSNEIGTIVEAIRKISSQTNLLAINASIEAAHAGEHGKGFSVVASEVRILAESSRKAATEIEHMTKTIQNGVMAAIKGMGVCVEQAGGGVTLTQDAGEVIHQVNIGMQDVVKLMTAFSQVKNQQPHI
ncbi:TPA: PAS domain S-box protein [Yersinia enterocolitica]|uniref:methyl-accepting chemotaxis protein n=1 Tax=Yersinia enterocolitica TaxID=630 RepID=UPI0005E1E59B|nr:PAS domain-containing methyl-accepting chemotaxis protein [Yersinia enterocolitica]EKN3725233.1 PAS domain-containing methyl-accepting chemotaxis protein [Yersinia enterocolitica]EKN4810208.1 PAS domain-containing methyl-accepting chemotaxis protein [Yersinia enterocolitica]ELI8169873.1 PAS domain-containing methyl-accepting chemotaxis protein [Yersinia enterocolitica]ELW7387813.1 PAS domain-containing methyl-accepting chemotaxis protein [Yersinia enterocolitica]ELZ1904850.1 PAS domain-cont